MKARSISALSAILICAAGCAGSGSQVTGPIPIAPPPVADLEGANLTGSSADLVMPLRVVSQSNGRTVTLIGAYADPARTVLVFRTMPPTEVAQVQVADQQGVLNASNSAGLGSIGDQYFALDAGPRVGSDGVAHLTVTILDFRSAPPSTQHTPGNWTFPLALKVQPGTPLYLSPALISVGSWNVNVEAAEVTPSVIHFQAVIDGASVSDIGQSTITLHDARGHAVSPVSYGASVTVPKQQLNSNNYKTTRVNVMWARPENAATYQLQISGGGAEYQGTVAIRAQAVVVPRKYGPPPDPGDFTQDSIGPIDLQGVFTAKILTGHPFLCSQSGSAGGLFGSDTRIFWFGTHFQVDRAWYVIDFHTDPSVRGYSGPGTYTAHADIYTYTRMDVDRIFDGTVQLTVTSDKGTATGSVNGTLTWTAASSDKFRVHVRGNWTCRGNPAPGPG